jgi:hypothetical protein
MNPVAPGRYNSCDQDFQILLMIRYDLCLTVFDFLSKKQNPQQPSLLGISITCSHAGRLCPP